MGSPERADRTGQHSKQEMKRTTLFRGTGTALVTPFKADLSFDEASFRGLIRHQIEAGIDALIVLGTTGENPTISDGERDRIVRIAVQEAAGRTQIIVGTGTNDTAMSVRYSRRAAEAGANGLLVVGPYYNKPSQRGFAAHVQAIASATDCPIVLYNVPGRTGFKATADTVLQLANDVPSVGAIKEASGDMAQIGDILAGRPSSFRVYSGDDELTQPMLALGADGVVSVVSNALPRRFAQMVAAGLASDFVSARRIHFEMLPVMRACFAVTNPVPIKAMLAHQGLISEYVRLPLVTLDAMERARVLEPLDRLTARAA